MLAVGSPGGSTIITTVLQTLVNRIDLGMTLPEAVAAREIAARRGEVAAEPEFIAAYQAELAAASGLSRRRSGDGPTSAADIGAVAALESSVRPGPGRASRRRAGADAGVVRPRSR